MPVKTSNPSVFTINEDGTINWVDHNATTQVEPFYVSSGFDIDAQRSGVSSKMKVYDSEPRILSFIKAFQNANAPISKKMQDKILKEISIVALRKLFIEKVQEWNRQYKMIIADEKKFKEIQHQRRLERKKQEQWYERNGVVIRSKTREKSNKKSSSSSKNKEQIHAAIEQANHIQQQISKLAVEAIQQVSKTGESMVIGNFKVSKLK